MTRRAMSPSCTPSVSIVADKTIQCMFVLLIAGVAVADVFQSQRQKGCLPKYGNSQFIRQ